MLQGGVWLGWAAATFWGDVMVWTFARAVGLKFSFELRDSDVWWCAGHRT